MPILAHLLNRQQVKRTHWAAMQFLNRNLRVRSRQLRLRDVLLLILRCLALLLLVFALSRPFWPAGSGGWFGGEPRAGVVIAIDSSFSMGHGSEGTSRFDRALEQAKIIAESIQPGDPVSLVLMGGQDEALVHNMAFAQERFNQLLETAKPSASGLELDRVPKRIEELLEDMDSPQKEAYFITDVQARDWRRVSSSFQTAFSKLQEKANVFLVPLPGLAANVAVTDLSLVSGVLRKGTTARYQATIRNYGSEPVANLEVRCRINGVQIDAKTIPLVKAGASETVSLFVPFHNAGPARITAEITDDHLPADNLRNMVSIVRERVSILCVDGSNGDAGR
ncbi:MAG: BatA domain-containing protein, partial [Verrucomicrobiota bacterium]|nr:BatA domain-containing protein [Verrucomicrobiota bacterium]